MLIALTSMAAFFLATAMDGVMGPDGFGLFGNMIILISGFFIGLYIANKYGIRLNNYDLIAIAGIAASFMSLAVLAVMKALLNRL
ncbi:MAG TPA: hypothetical protein PKE65_01700 [Rhizobiaceae bacterium]|nr:hypothetical protein [Rhizobiaceae bacterium]